MGVICGVFTVMTFIVVLVYVFIYFFIRDRFTGELHGELVSAPPQLVLET